MCNLTMYNKTQFSINEYCWFSRGEARTEGLMKHSGGQSLGLRERGHDIPFTQKNRVAEYVRMLMCVKMRVLLLCLSHAFV